MSKKAAAKPKKENAKNQKNKEVTQATVNKQRQALVLADSFDSFMRPLSLEKPRVLFPLVNVPLIEYTLEFLASQDVDQIYLFCCSHADQIIDYIESSDWSTNQDVTVTPIVSKAKDMTAGDALREVNSKLILRDDFILIYGDVVANIDLAPIITAHTERKKKDKESIITAVFKEALPGHRTRAYHDDTVLAYDCETKQILSYDTAPNSKFVEIDPKRLTHSQHKKIEFRHDLIDCGIAICSTDVLYQFQENFDYANIQQFTRGVVNEEILSSKANVHIIKGKYAARVNCFRTYKSISNDVVNRWTYPLVPDSNLVGSTAYRASSNLIYKDRDVKLAQSSKIGEKTVIGEATVIGENSLITDSIIGKNCVIGENVTLKGCVIWDNVTIGSGVTITDSLIAENVKILSKATINTGSVVCSDVVIGENHVVPPFTKLLRSKQQSKEIDLGPGGVGRVWAGLVTAPTRDPTYQSLLAATKELVPTEWEITTKKQFETSDSDSEPEEEPTYMPTRERFLKEVYDTVSRTETEGGGAEWTDNVAVELKSLKYAYDTTFLDSSESILLALINFATVGDINQLQQLFRKWKPLLDTFLSGAERADDELEILFKLQAFCETNARHSQHFISILKCLHSASIASSKSLKTWAEEQALDEEEDSEEKQEEERPKIYTQQMVDELLEWLKAKEYSAGVFTDSEDEMELKPKTPAKRNQGNEVGSGESSDLDGDSEEGGWGVIKAAAQAEEDLEDGWGAILKQKDSQANPWGEDSYSGSD